MASLGFARNTENLLLLGKTGQGKTHLAVALGRRLCADGIPTIFMPVNLLFEEVAAAKAAGGYLKFLKKVNEAEALILDDFGLRAYSHDEATILVDLLEDDIATESSSSLRRSTLEAGSSSSKIRLSPKPSSTGSVTSANASLSKVAPTENASANPPPERRCAPISPPELGPHGRSIRKPDPFLPQTTAIASPFVKNQTFDRSTDDERVTVMNEH